MTETASRPLDRIITNPADRRAAAVAIIRGARRSIGLSLFRCNDEEILQELRAAVDRGIQVEVLVTSRAKGGKKKLKKLWAALEATGASVRPYTDPVVKYHAKYMVADDGPALVSSLNFTRKCFNRTCDAMLITHDPAVVSGLRDLMAADRDSRSIPDSVPPRLIVGPERARRQFMELLGRAQKSIRLIDAKVSDPGLIAVLNARREAGVIVDVFGAKRYGDLRSHGKIMLIDGVTAVVGSLALAALSLDFRREVAVIVDEPSAVAEIDQLFRFVAAAAAKDAGVAADAAGGAAC